MIDDRIQWVKRQVLVGVSVRVYIGPAYDIRKCKVKILIEPWKAALPWASQHLLLGILGTLEAAGQTYVCVDRGHKHSGGGSEISLWLHQPTESHGQYEETPHAGAAEPAETTPGGPTGDGVVGTKAAASGEQVETEDKKDKEKKEAKDNAGKQTGATQLESREPASERDEEEVDDRDDTESDTNSTCTDELENRLATLHGSRNRLTTRMVDNEQALGRMVPQPQRKPLQDLLEEHGRMAMEMVRIAQHIEAVQTRLQPSSIRSSEEDEHG